MKIIKFEENFIRVEARIYSLSRVILESFFGVGKPNELHLVSGNKPSCRQGQYQTFRLSKMLFSSFIVVSLLDVVDVLTC